MARRLTGLLWPERRPVVIVPPGLYLLLFVGAVVFLLVFPWHAVNQRLPIWDAADYVLNAQRIIEHFDGGLLGGLKSLYLERGWRPIIFPALTTPFFVLSDGQILLAVGLTQFAVVWLLAGYVFGFLGTMLSPPRAAVGALLIVSTQWIVNFSNVFYSELAWLAAAAGTIFHATSAYNRASLKHFMAGGFWLGLMVALRPAETAVLAIIPSAVLIFREWKGGVIRGADIGLFAMQLLSVGAAVWMLTLPERNIPIALGLLGISCLIIAVAAKRLTAGRSVLFLLIVAEVIALAWHLPTMRALYLWAYDTSFGPMARLSDQKFIGLAPWAVFWELVQHYSPKLLLFVAFAAILGAVSVREPKLDQARKQAIFTIFVAFLMVAPVLALLSISGTSDMRRIMPAMLVLEMGLTALALSPNGSLARTRAVVLLLLLTAQTVSATANGLNIRLPALTAIKDVTGHLRQPYAGADPNPPVLDGLLTLGVRNGNIAAYTYCYRDYANCERLGLPVFEPMALSTLAKERHLPIHVHFIGDLDFSKPETLSAQIKARNFDYVLVDMFDAPAAVVWADPYVVHTKYFISLQRDRLPEGLISRGCFSTLKRPICVIEATRRH